jgi:hypothetical protein
LASTGSTLADRMRAAANLVVESLDVEGRAAALAPFDVSDRRAWTYLPGPRPGAMLADLSPACREHVMALVDAGLSAAGARRAREVMELDGVLRDLEREAGRPGWQRRHPLHYWFRLLGNPTDEVWACHVGGHHLAVHLTVVGDQVSGTPQFFGANPAVVPRGPRQGWQVLRPEEETARALLAALQPDQRERAVVSATAPNDIATRRDPVADPALVPTGLARGALTGQQRRLLEAVVGCYVDRVAADVSRPAWQAVRGADDDGVTFAWAGSTQVGGPHYYAVRGPTFLLEYDNTQDGANHVHTVWRDLGRDWGADLLAQHHAAAHRVTER